MYYLEEMLRRSMIIQGDYNHPTAQKYPQDRCHSDALLRRNEHRKNQEEKRENTESCEEGELGRLEEWEEEEEEEEEEAEEEEAAAEEEEEEAEEEEGAAEVGELVSGVNKIKFRGFDPRC
ncbi:hypothetical protein M8J77_025787 [Diaphorina citri]|nr:hypothetical protein M8J77_025787 [Diaphorina citri]